MANIETSRAMPRAFHFATQLNAVASNAIAAFANWNGTRATRKALKKLTDRELNDIGLCRGDIDSIGN